jgi:dTDP-4-dehydrorhamnose 3,5-epimerase
MQVTTYAINGPALIKPARHGDHRGYFMETFKDAWFRDTVADVAFVQDNQAMSAEAGTIRGLHFQTAPSAQGKLIRCLRGAIFDVAVDIRPGSTTLGQWVGVTLTADNGEQLWIPEGFAHGYCTLTVDTEVFYKVTAPYSPADEGGLAFDDPDVGVHWPVPREAAILSARDREQPRLKALMALMRG